MIGYYIHHHGRGHLQRFFCIARHLRTPLTALSSLPRPDWWAGPWVVLARDDDGRPREVAAGGAAHWAPLGHAGFRRRGLQIAAWIADARPSLVVTDVSVEVTLLVRLLGVPVVVVAMRGARTDPPHRAAYSAAEHLLAPWPSSLQPAWYPEDWREKTWNVGSFSQFDDSPNDGIRDAHEGRVFVLWGQGGATVGPKDIGAAAEACPGWTWSYAGWDRPAPPRRVWDELCRADVVVCHGGTNAVSEVAAARRPAVVVAEPRPFAEQEDTAATLDRAGIATGLARWPDAAAWPRILDAARTRGGLGWERWHSGRGAVRAAHLLDQAATGALA